MLEEPTVSFAVGVAGTGHVGRNCDYLVALGCHAEAGTLLAWERWVGASDGGLCC